VSRSGWFTEVSTGSFFQRVDDSGRTDLQHPGCIADPTAIEAHVHDLVLDRRGASFIEEIQLKAIPKTVDVLALIALLTSLGLTAFDDVIAVTAGTKHGHECHDALLLKESAAWHTCR
jgi:hypothetical protein